MKRFLILILLLFCNVARAQITTATVTVTNQAANGYTFSVNGSVRTWTNTVTSAATQIPTYIGTNTSLSCSNAAEFATNLWISYIIYPQASISVQLTASNVLTFVSYPNIGLTITTNGTASNWVNFSYATNQITNETVIRTPVTGLGIPEQSNSANGIIAYLNSQYLTSLVNIQTTSNGYSSEVTNFISGITATNWHNTNVDGDISFSGTNVAIYDQNSNLFWGPGTFASATNAMPTYIRTNWFVTNTSITLSFH